MGDAQDTADARPGRWRRMLRRRSTIVLLIVAVVVTAGIVVTQATPMPFVALFRAVAGGTKGVIVLGDHADDAAAVTTIAEFDVPVDGLPDAELTVYAPPAAGAGLPMVLFVHGGGWVTGSAASVADYARLLAANGYVVANLDYSLAPEYRHPTQVRQVVAALEALQARAGELGGDPERLVIAGNSAGAQLAAAAAALVSDADLQRETGIRPSVDPSALAALVLFNGVFDFDTVGRDDFPGFGTFAWSYTGWKDYAAYPRLDELSAARHVTADFPATFLTAGDADPIEAQTYEFDAVLRAADVPVSSLYWTGTGRGLGHDYMYDLTDAAAETAYRAVVDFLAAHTR